MAVEVRRLGVADRVQLRLDGQPIPGQPKADNVVNVDNVYLDYCQVPRTQRSAIVRNFLSLFTASTDESSPTREEAMTMLLPIVRDPMFFNAGDQLHNRADRKLTPIYRPLNDELAQGLCIDRAESVMTVSPSLLAEWNMSIDEAFAVARKNFEALPDKPFAMLSPGLFVSDFGDYHDVSRLLRPELFTQLAIRGDPVVAVPNRSIVLVAGSRDDRALDLAAQLARKHLEEQSRPLSGTLFRLENFEWKPWLPATSSSAYPAARDLATIGHASRYSDQQAAIERALQRAGRDCFVANVSIMKSEALRVLYSYCVWPSEITDGMISRTDLVVVAGPNDDHRVVLWDDLLRVAGHRLTELPGVRPHRYAYTSWPDASELDRMNAGSMDAAIDRLAAIHG